MTTRSSICEDSQASFAARPAVLESPVEIGPSVSGRVLAFSTDEGMEAVGPRAWDLGERGDDSDPGARERDQAGSGELIEVDGPG